MYSRQELYIIASIIVLGISSCTMNVSSSIHAIANRPETPLPIEVDEDIPYMENRALDIFAPEEVGSWPIVVVLHGSGVNRKSLSELSAAIASNGAIVITPTWSSLPPQPSYITKGWDGGYGIGTCITYNNWSY